MAQRSVCLTTLLVALFCTASAQVITIRTAPVAQGDQFDIFPSQNRGMGGVSIAVTDSQLDPFANPAKAARLGGSRFYGSPTLYSVSGNTGGGRTLPLAAFGRAGAWFGGLSVALQEVDASRQQQPVFGFPCPECGRLDVSMADFGREEHAYGNTYAFATVGKTFPGSGLSVAGSVSWAGLKGVDGVDLLYTRSAGLRQRGRALDLRLGMTKELRGDRSLEALIVHNRFDATHDVVYLDTFWNPATQQVEQRPRLEPNADRTNVWGLHLEYERPLTSTGWRIGWLATVNRVTHPMTPHYDVMSIPGDRGHASAFNVGVGLSRQRGPATFAVDLIYEPIRSQTWAEAEAPTVAATGDTIRPGGRTVENDFRFSNALFRLGMSRDISRALGLQLGLIVRDTHYWLAQYDNVTALARNQEERWMEWTPTWGLSLRFPDMEIRYRGRVTHGTERPVQSSGCCFAGAERLVLTGNSIVPGVPRTTMANVRVAMHQVSISLPLR
jgi:hypothetical protein